LASASALRTDLRRCIIGFEGRFDYAAIGTVSNVASRLCDEAKPGQILIGPRVLTKVENAVKVEPVGEFELKGIRRPLAAYNVVALTPSCMCATSRMKTASACFREKTQRAARI
jgi:class 3 adenylate cyclase